MFLKFLFFPFFIRYFLHLHLKCYPQSPLYPSPALLPKPPTPTSWPRHYPISKIQFAKHMKLKKEDQIVDTVLLLRIGSKIPMEGVTETKFGAEMEGRFLNFQGNSGAVKGDECLVRLLLLMDIHINILCCKLLIQFKILFYFMCELVMNFLTCNYVF